MDRLIVDLIERVIADMQLVPFKNKECFFFGLKHAKDIVSRHSLGKFKVLLQLDLIVYFFSKSSSYAFIIYLFHSNFT